MHLMKILVLRNFMPELQWFVRKGSGCTTRDFAYPYALRSDLGVDRVDLTHGLGTWLFVRNLFPKAFSKKFEYIADMLKLLLGQEMKMKRCPCDSKKGCALVVVWCVCFVLFWFVFCVNIVFGCFWCVSVAVCVWCFVFVCRCQFVCF